jgi:hypothetical protein
MVRHCTLKQWAKAMKSFPKYAIAQTLNKLVYEAKQTAPSRIGRAMTLRSPGFIASSIGYNKASRGHLEAVWGMKPRGKTFTGLADQEFGRTTSKRAATMAARGGTLKSKVKPSLRLKRSNKVAKMEDLNPKPANWKQAVAMWRQSGYRGLVELGHWSKGSDRSGAQIEKRGIFRLVGGKKFKRIQLVQALGDIPQQKRRRWMAPTNFTVKKQIKKHWASAVSASISRGLR